VTPVTGRPTDWEQLVCKNENKLYRIALAMLGSAAEAEDAVQDAFLKYLEKLPRLRQPEDAERWLMRVLINGCKDRLRSAYHRSSVALTEELLAPRPEERETLEELMALPPADRVLIHLYYYEGYTTGEIAAMLGISRSYVSRIEKKALGKLERVLNESRMV